jgi:hypothetical protein
MGARPFTLRCPKCKRGEDFERGDRGSNQRLFTTGETLIAKRYGRRHNVAMTEIVHADCGHAFWTDHISARSKPLAISIIEIRSYGRKPSGVKP